MGNDGGSIPTRRELVKEAAKEKTTTEKKQSQHERQEYHWTTDPISQKPLEQPVVSDCNGKLYNKVTILEYLVEGGAKIGAVKSQKDVVQVKFDGGDGHDTWKCSITGDKLGTGSKAVYIVPCGHAFSGAIKELSEKKCPTCETEYAPNDLIPILPTAETEIVRLSLRMKMLEEQGLTHSLKKVSGSKKRKNKVDDTNGYQINGEVAVAKNSDSANGVGSKSEITKRVEQEVAKKRKVESDNVKGLFSTKEQSHNTDFMTRGFSIPNKVNK
jgi:hypothetical protein